MLSAVDLDRPLDDAVEYVLAGLVELDAHEGRSKTAVPDMTVSSIDHLADLIG